MNRTVLVKLCHESFPPLFFCASASCSLDSASIGASCSLTDTGAYAIGMAVEVLPEARSGMI